MNGKKLMAGKRRKRVRRAGSKDCPAWRNWRKWQKRSKKVLYMESPIISEIWISLHCQFSWYNWQQLQTGHRPEDNNRGIWKSGSWDTFTVSWAQNRARIREFLWEDRGGQCINLEMSRIVYKGDWVEKSQVVVPQQRGKENDDRQC